MSELLSPFDTFRHEIPAGSYKSFGIPDNDPYPLKGVTYPVEYGDIPGYVGEDGDDLDVFVGSGSLYGFIQVWRPDVPTEHKFYVNLTEDEEAAVLKAFEPVLETSGRYESYSELLAAIQPFQK